MPGRATIHEVARVVGVSTSTVSRAFNAPHMLRPATVDRVVAVAERLGYVPNLHARALVTGKTGLLGLIVPDITNPFFPPMVRAAQRAAEERGLGVMMAESNSVPDRERAHIASLSPHCEGLIIASSRLTPEELRQIASTMRLVLINNDTSDVARVLVSSADALSAGVRHIAERGAATFCYVGGPHRSWSEHERRSTVERVTAELGLPTTYLRDESGTYHEARRMAAERPFDADAIVAFDDVIACGILDGLSDRGLSIPRDGYLLGCDDALPIQTSPRLLTIRLRGSEAVIEAVRLLTSARGDTVAEERILLPGTLMLRETA
ncbi:LacI family DNA-binding transcriptional regulator [Propioniciclava flava]